MKLNRLLAVIALVILPWQASIVSAADNNIVAVFNGEAITMQQIRDSNATEIFEAEKKLYDLQYAALRSLLIDKIIALDPRAKGLNAEKFLSTYVVSPKPVSDEAVAQFIIERHIPKERVNANLKEQVRQYMTQQQIVTQVDAWLDKQLPKHQVSIQLGKPVEPRFNVDISRAPFRGNPEALVTIVEYSDFQCPYCAKVNPTLYQLTEQYGDKVKIAYKHLPLNELHPKAQKAAEAAVCVAQQGNEPFWAFHNKMFENQGNLELGQLKDYVNELKLDIKLFNECLNNPETAKRVAADAAEAHSVGLVATPAFLINGRLVQGALGLNDFKAVIDEELAAQH